MNPFEALASAQMVAATKAKHRAAEKREARVKVVRSDADAPMKLSEMEQAQADQSTQMRAYRAWHRAEAKVIEDRHGDDWRALVRVLRALSIDNGDELIAHVRAAAWLHGADLHTRRVVLRTIANAIIKARLENGYAPMSDSLMDEPPTVFEIIRNELRVLT